MSARLPRARHGSCMRAAATTCGCSSRAFSHSASSSRRWRCRSPSTRAGRPRRGRSKARRSCGPASASSTADARLRARCSSSAPASPSCSDSRYGRRPRRRRDPVANSAFVGAVLVAIAGLFSAWHCSATPRDVPASERHFRGRRLRVGPPVVARCRVARDRTLAADRIRGFPPCVVLLAIDRDAVRARRAACCAGRWRAFRRSCCCRRCSSRAIVAMAVAGSPGAPVRRRRLSCVAVRAGGRSSHCFSGSIATSGVRPTSPACRWTRGTRAPSGSCS